MTVTEHVIQRFSFELDVASRVEAGQVHERLSAFQADRLGSLLESCLSRIVPDDRVLSLDTMEVDLGELTLEQMEEELAARIPTAFMEALTANIRGPGDSTGSAGTEEVSLEARRLRQLAGFLEHGVLHWSVGSGPVDMDDLLIAVIETAPDALRRLLEELGRQTSVRQRLVHQFTRASLHRLIGLLVPQAAGTVIAIAQGINRIQEHRPLVSEDTEAFDGATWEAVLVYLLTEPGVAFDAQRLVAVTLRSVSRRYGLDEDRLIEAMLVRSRLVAGVGDALPALLQALRGASDAEPQSARIGDRGSAGTEDKQGADDELELIIRFLREGSAPDGVSAPVEAPMGELLRRVLARHPGELGARLGPGILRLPALRQRLLALVSDDDLGRLLAGLHAQAGLLLEAAKRVLADEGVPAAADPSGRRLAVYDALLVFATRTRAAAVTSEEVLGFLRRDPGAGQPGTPAPSNDRPTATSGEVDLLIHLLRYGNLPWWGRDLADRAMADWFNTLLRDQEDRVLVALRAIRECPDALDRLVRYLPREALARLVEVLVPDYAGFVMTYLLAGERLAAESRVPAAAPSTQWTIVLGRLLDPHGPRLDPEVFVAESGYRTARRLGMTHAAYLETLLAHANDRTQAEARLEPLRDILSRQLGEIQGDPSDAPGLPEPAKDEAQAGPPSLLEEPPVSSITPERCDDIVFLTRRFLRYGALPSESEVDTTRELEARLIEAMPGKAKALRELFLAAVGDPVVRARMVARFSQPMLEAIVLLLSPAAAARAMPAIEPLGALAGAAIGLGGDRWRVLAIEALLAAIAGEPEQALDQPNFVKSLLRQVAREVGMDYPHLLARLQAASGRSVSPAPPESHRLKTEIGRSVSASRPRRPRRQSQTVEAANLSPVEIAGLLSRLRDEAEADTPIAPVRPPRPREGRPWRLPGMGDEEQAFPLGEPCYVDNAGLVILWPFLPRYFGGLEMLQEGAFRDATAAERAVHLLQFLVDGETDAPEYRLVINKLLCGLDMSAPVVGHIRVTKREARLSEELLYGVTQNWPPLRNTSIAGLREAFLQREGRLLRGEDSWSLVVAAKPYDMLLDNLPWALSTVRLRWMKEALYVTWR